MRVRQFASDNNFVRKGLCHRAKFVEDVGMGYFGKILRSYGTRWQAPMSHVRQKCYESRSRGNSYVNGLPVFFGKIFAIFAACSS